MSRKDEALVKMLVMGMAVIGGLTILASSPNCDRGCETVVQHLTEHVLGDMLNELLTA